MIQDDGDPLGRSAYPHPPREPRPQRPTFTPPPGYPPAPAPPPAVQAWPPQVPPQAPPRVPLVPAVLVTLGSALLLAAAFLPWLRLEWDGPDLGFAVAASDYSGLRADGTGSISALCGCAALGLAAGAVALRRPALLGWAALPGGLALAACVVFGLREQSPGYRVADLTPLPLRATLAYGWYVALLAAVVVLVAPLLVGGRSFANSWRTAEPGGAEPGDERGMTAS